MPPSKLIRQRRLWLTFLLLMVANVGTGSAAPLYSGSSHPSMTNTLWLWPVQAQRRQTNVASVSLEIRPSQTVNIGTKVSFGVTARKLGYLLLVDVDAEGRMSQIFPTPELLAQSEGHDINLVKPGVEFVVPTPAARQRGFEYVVSPPAGAAVMVAILSERRVQLLDLPDLPRKLEGQAEALSYLSAWTGELRVPDSDSGKLVSSSWSFDIKSYSIK